MTGPLLALLSSIGWGTSDYLGGRRSRQHGVLRVLVVSQAVALLAVAGVVAVRGVSLPREIVVVGMLAGLAEAVAIASLYRGLAVGRAGLVAPASAISPVVPLTVSILDGDVPGGLRWAGVLLVLVGLLTASREPRTEGEPAGVDLRSLGYGLVAGIGFGTYFTLMAQASAVSVPWALVLARGTALTVLLAALAVTLVTVRSIGLTRRDLPLLVLLGLLVAVADGAYALSSTFGDLALVAVISATHPVITILWARFHGREPVSGRRWAGVAVVVLGVVALTAG